MSAFPDEPNHFLDWLQREERGIANPHGFVPRATYRRYIRVQQVHALRVSLWVIALCGYGSLAVWSIDGPKFHELPERIAVFPLIGVVTTGWAFVSKRRREYLPPFAISLIAFFIVAAICISTR